jgi:hypothetical protein
MLCEDWREFYPLMGSSRKGFGIQSIFLETPEGGATTAGRSAVDCDSGRKKVESILEVRRQKRNIGLSV